MQQLYQGWRAFAAIRLGVAGLDDDPAADPGAASAAPLAHQPTTRSRRIWSSASPPPSAEHIGSAPTAIRARCVFARIVYGARTTLYIVMLVTVIVAPIGLLIGTTCAGYLGGWVDEASNT